MRGGVRLPALERLAADVRNVEIGDAELVLPVEQLRGEALVSVAALVLLLCLSHAVHVELRS